MTTFHSNQISSQELVERYLSFFVANDHTLLAGAPLVTPDNSTSFVIAGMQPLLPYLRGQVEPPARRLTSLQRCLRSDDAELVGANGRKNTAFHMLGNWSINNYGKQTAIRMAYQFLCEHLLLDPSQLWVSIFGGCSELCLLPDHLARETWLNLGIASNRIVQLGVEDNFWTMGERPGPCGPCSEIYIDRGVAWGCGKPDCQPGCTCERFLEVWNLVFMEFERLPTGRLTPLPVRNINTGLGVERMASWLQNVPTVFDIDLFQPAAKRLVELIGPGSSIQSYEPERAQRIIVDHGRAVLLAGLAGVVPGRTGSQSVMRRLIRRAVCQGRNLGIDKPFLYSLLDPLVEGHGTLLTPEERDQVPALSTLIYQEEQAFERVLTRGLRHLGQLEPDSHGTLPGQALFRLHAEKGFPADLAAEILTGRGIKIDWIGYQRATEEHQRVSRASLHTHFVPGD